VSACIADCLLTTVDGDPVDYKDKGLLDTGCTVYSVIIEVLVDTVYEKLNIKPIPLANPRPLRAYNRQLASNSISHAIYATLVVNGYAEQTCPMLIVSLGNHSIIVGKPWMNKHGVILDMKYDRLVYKSNRYRCCYPEATFNVNSKAASLPATPIVKETPSYVMKMKKKSSKPELSSTTATKGTLDEASVEDPAPERLLDIAHMSAASFYRLKSRV